MARPEWITSALASPPDPANRIIDITVDEVDHEGGTFGLITLRFHAEDLRGQPYQAQARIYLPDTLRTDPNRKLPVWFNCGYEVQDAAALAQVRRGRIVITPCDPEPDAVYPHSNPLARGPNTDIVLAHLVRALPFVDPTAIIYTGGSAGGYAALLVAAEAFPALAVLTNAPVLNMAYQTAYFSDLVPRVLAAPPPEQPLLPLLMGAMDDILNGARAAYGEGVANPAWWDHSPLAHLDRITSPAATLVSTADFLVPIVQVGRELAAATLANLPGDMRMAPEDLADTPHVGKNLIDELEGQATIEIVPVPEGAAEMQLADLDLTLSTPATPVALAGWAKDGPKWSITVVDEGPTVFGATHGRHQLQPDFEPLVADRLAATEPIAVDQLTPAKLNQLLDRHQGVEWLAPGFSHLDQPAAERADVERSIRVYASVSPRHAARFLELYEHIEPPRQSLPADLVSEVRGQAS